MGGKKATTTSQVTIPPEVLARYNAVNQRAETAAAKPFQAFGNTAADYVAQLNPQQFAGFNDINATAGSYQPYMTQATQATQAGMGPAYAGIDNYMSPYIKNVADTTGALMKQQFEQAQSGALGTAASSGAFGGDRAGIAAANLQQQNQLGYGKTMADIYNQGYTQALGASQADLARQLQGGSQMAGLGAQSQQLGLQGAQAKIAAGTMQQQTEQAGKDALINRFMQEQGLPYQQAQFLANIAMGTGAASGSTTTTQTPRNWLGFADGGHVEGYADGGGVAGPMSYSQSQIGDQGYVPEANLPVGQLMVANPPEQQQSNGTDEIIKIISMMSGGKKNGGAIDQRHGYALDGSVEDLGNRIRFDDALIEQFGGVKPVVPDGRDGELPDSGSVPRFNPPYPGARSTYPLTTEELRNRVNDPDYYGVRGFENARNLANARDRVQTNPANMGIGAGHNMGYRTYGHPYPPSPTTGVAAPSPIDALQVTPEDDAARRAMMARALGAREPRASERYMLPTTTGVVAPPTNKLETLDFGAMLNAEDTSPVPVVAPTPPLGTPPAPRGPTMVDMEPVPSQFFGNITRDTRGNLYAENGNRMITDPDEKNIAAREFSNEMKRRALVAEQKVFEAGDSPQFLGDAFQAGQDVAEAKKAAAQAQANLGGLPVQRPAYSSRFDVPAGGLPSAPPPRYQIPTSLGSPTAFGLPPGPPPTGGVVTPAMTARPAGVQQPMAFTAGAEPRYTLPTGLGTPTPSSNLAVAASQRPQPRPADLGATVAASNAIQTSGTDAVTPPINTNGVAGPEQTGVYTGVAGAGAGFVDLVRPDGTVEHRTGARNWRNNNPGNIEYGKLAQQYGAIGTDGRFAIFPDEQTGRNAMKGLLFDSGVYQGMTIASALNKYSPPSENDTEGKIRTVVAETGLDPNTPLDQMTPQQRDAFVLAIQHTEGPMKGDVGASSPYTTSQAGGLGAAKVNAGTNVGGVNGGLFNPNKPFNQRNMVGKFFHNEDGTLNTNAVLSLLSGIGSAAQAQTISPLGGILAGVGAGADTYKGLLKQQADIGLTQAQAYRENVGADVGRFFTWGNIPMVSLGNGKAVKISEYLASPEAYSTGNAQQDAAILREAQTRANTEESAPANTRWTSASNDAIAAAKQYAASDVGAVNFVGNNEAVQNLTLQANEAMNYAVAAKPNVNELAYTIGSSIADGTMGSAQGRNFVLQNVLAPLNSILRSAGVNMDALDDTQTQAQLLDKIRTLNADSLTPEQQRSKAVFEQFANVSPNLEMTPDAAAAITSSLMLSNQDSIDIANYYSRFQQEAGMGFAPQQMSSGYTNEYGQLHQIEKNNLTNLFTAAEDKTVLGNSGMTRGQYVKNFLDKANAGGLSQDQAQSILNYILGPENTSQALARYFIKGM